MSDPLALLLGELAALPRHDPHDARVRLAVAGRARGVCEYCLLPTGGQFQIDHIIPPARWDTYVTGQLRGVAPLPARGGPDHLDNFAWCCPFCNRAKGQHVAFRVGRRTSRLFDPRRDRWEEHFCLAHHYLFIVGVTAIGKATERALGFNDNRLDGLLGARHDAVMVERYPPPWARRWLIETDL